MPAADPYSAVIGAVAGLATPAPAGPSEAKSSGSIGTNLDNSGWNVTFGNNSAIDATRSQSAPTVAATGGAQTGPASALAGLGIDTNMLLLGLGALVLVKLMKRKKSS